MSLSESMSKINKIEKDFEELLVGEPKVLSASIFHTGMHDLLVNYLGFRYIDQTNIVYQYYRDVYEDNSFWKGKPKGIIAADKNNFEEVSKRINKYLKGNGPENLSRKLIYIGKQGEKATVSSHHGSLQDLRENRLRSSNLNLSTTIVSKSNLGLNKFERTIPPFGKNPGELIMEGKDNPITKAFEQDYIPIYRKRYLPNPFQVIEAAEKHLENTSIRSQPRQPSIFA